MCVFGMAGGGYKKVQDLTTEQKDVNIKKAPMGKSEYSIVFLIT